MRVTERRMKVHWVPLLGAVYEHGTADAVPHHGKGPARSFTVRRRPSHNRPACLTPARPVDNIFVLTGDIGSWGQGGGRAGMGEDARAQGRAELGVGEQGGEPGTE